MFYRLFIKPFLFLFPAEKAHHISTSIFGIITSIPVLKSIVKFIFSYDAPVLEKTVFGIRFPNPVGLAAGFDKEGKHYKAMSHLGFGFIEIGTVTPKGQAGNPQPRLFRLPEDKALINRMGFNNEGVEGMVERLKKDTSRHIIIGGNIGKNKVTPNEEAINDYEICFNALYPHVDYFVVNVSSPNTPNLRALQDKEPLNRLLARMAELRQTKKEYKPILLKIAPDLGFEQINDTLDIIESNKIDGIIATNTTISRENLKSGQNRIDEIGNGGLSGQPLHKRSVEVVKYIRSRKPELAIIGVGGICSDKDAINMLAAGADLIQLYSGMIYEGPSIVRKIKKAIKNSI
ncbi:MAG: quinone-dependent dihydroorotate dehydrogenase [Saprospiraceae bacterium]|nr:quinone-dependent dihydroorotate dehydrogenase [Saprospiraceae bacterium]